VAGRKVEGREGGGGPREKIQRRDTQIEVSYKF